MLLWRLNAVPFRSESLVGVSGAGKGVGEVIVDIIGQTRGISGELSHT